MYMHSTFSQRLDPHRTWVREMSVGAIAEICRDVVDRRSVRCNREVALFGVQCGAKAARPDRFCGGVSTLTSGAAKSDMVPLGCTRLHASPAETTSQHSVRYPGNLLLRWEKRSQQAAQVVHGLRIECGNSGADCSSPHWQCSILTRN